MKCHLSRKLLPCLLYVAVAPLACADDLLDIYHRALAQDPVLGEARARYGAEHTLLAQDRSALLPRVTLSGSTSRNTYARETAWSYANGFNTHNYSVSLEQNLLNMQAWYSWQAARENDQRALATLTVAEQGLIVRVATAYFDVLRSVDNLAAFSAEETAAANLLQQTLLRFDAGLAAITEVNEAQAGSDLARVNRLVEERNLNTKRLVLEAITGASHGELEELRADFPVSAPEPARPEAWVELAASNSPALKVAEHDFAARSDEARAARSAHLPVLSIGARYLDTAEQNNTISLLAAASRNTQVALTVTIPLFNGGATSARKRQAYYARDASEQALVGTRRENERSVRDSYIGVEIGVAAVQARQQALVSAQSAVEAIQAGMEVGTRSVVDVGQAQRTLYQALREYATARYDYVVDTLKLKQAAGVLTPQDVLDLNEWLQ